MSIELEERPEQMKMVTQFLYVHKKIFHFLEILKRLLREKFLLKKIIPSMLSLLSQQRRRGEDHVAS